MEREGIREPVGLKGHAARPEIVGIAHSGRAGLVQAHGDLKFKFNCILPVQGHLLPDSV